MNELRDRVRTTQSWTTDATGEFEIASLPVGQQLTLTFELSGYTTTRFPTLNVPAGGLVSEAQRVGFQVCVCACACVVFVQHCVRLCACLCAVDYMCAGVWRCC